MKKILSYIIIICLFLVAGVRTSAIDARYKNNLLNVELSQTPDNRVSVLLVFEKPYTEPVKVIYKTNNEYNILLPETYHSVTSISTLNALNIRSANAKLVPYFNQDNSNGYTKITLQTTRPVVFNAHASYITTQIAQDDLIEKIEKDETLKITPTKVSMANSSQQKTTKPKKVQKTTTVAKAKPKQTKVATKPQTKPTQPIKKAEVKPAEKTNIVAIAPEKTAITQPVMTQIIEPTTENIKDIKPAIENNTQPTTEVKTQKTQQNDVLATLKEKSIQPQYIMLCAILLLLVLLNKVTRRKKKEQQPRTIIPPHYNYEENIQTEEIPQEIKDLSWQEKYKFMKEKENKSQENFVSTVNNTQHDVESEIVKDESNHLEEENYLDIEQHSANEPLITPEEMVTINIEDNEEPETINDILNNLEEKDIQIDTFELDNSQQSESFEQTIAQIEVEDYTNKNATIEIENELEKLSDISDIEPDVDELYEIAPDREEIEEVVVVDVEISETRATNPIEPTLINQAKISKTKGFYLVRYEDEVALMGYINEQIFLLHTFNNSEPTFVQTRLTEKQKGTEVYLVRTGNFKSLVKVTKDNMQTILNL